jgi:hypothetical protein
MCQAGATDREIAETLGIQEATFYRWRHSHPEFREALKLGKESADDRVEKALFRKAVGYSVDSIKIFQNNGIPVVVPYVEHVPPDTTAQIFWLKNRKKAEWRDRHDIDMTVASASLSDADLERIANATSSTKA